MVWYLSPWPQLPFFPNRKWRSISFSLTNWQSVWGALWGHSSIQRGNAAIGSLMRTVFIGERAFQPASLQRVSRKFSELNPSAPILHKMLRSEFFSPSFNAGLVTLASGSERFWSLVLLCLEGRHKSQGRLRSDPAELKHFVVPIIWKCRSAE